MIKFEFSNQEGKLNLIPDLEKLGRFISKQFKKSGKISIATVDSKTIKKLNKSYRGKAKSTDILTFVLNDGENLGEIILGYEEIKKRADFMKTTILATAIYLIIHGVFHIFGYKHNTLKETDKMQKEEDILLQKIGYCLNENRNILKKF